MRSYAIIARAGPSKGCKGFQAGEPQIRRLVAYDRNATNVRIEFVLSIGVARTSRFKPCRACSTATERLDGSNLLTPTHAEQSAPHAPGAGAVMLALHHPVRLDRADFRTKMTAAAMCDVAAWRRVSCKAPDCGGAGPCLKGA